MKRLAPASLVRVASRYGAEIVPEIDNDYPFVRLGGPCPPRPDMRTPLGGDSIAGSGSLYSLSSSCGLLSSELSPPCFSPGVESSSPPSSSPASCWWALVEFW